tara:strand:+ start:75 stop:320 length:246 start_codon:yes stop_codon:yes gene_type:complete
MTEDKNKYNVNLKSSSNQKIDPKKYKDFNKVYSKYTHWVYRNPWNRFQFHKSKNRKTALFLMLVLLVLSIVAMEYFKDLNP